MYILGLDETDNKIIEVIKDNARLSYSDIGKAVGLSRVAVKNRMDAMEKRGVIQGYQTLDAHVRYLYNHNERIRRLEWHMLVTTYKDEDGGVEYDGKVLCDF